MGTVKALVLRTAGTNCDQETAEALRSAGALPEIVHIHQIISGRKTLEDYRLMVIPGGFSYGDDIAAGKILANELRCKLEGPLANFISRGRLVIGICNGFQVLVKAGYLPGDNGRQPHATLGMNDSGRFQCHWTLLRREPSACAWLNQTDEDWELPIAHGEGKFWPDDVKLLEALEKNRQVVFRYQGGNPNGSVNRIAGLCNAEGTVVGLMPHPERHVRRSQHPEWTHLPARKGDPVGLQFFKAAVAYAGSSACR